MNQTTQMLHRVNLNYRAYLFFFSSILVCGESFLIHNQTQLLHLNPEPNASCNTRCPRFKFILLQVYSNSYQIDEEEVFP